MVEIIICRKIPKHLLALNESVIPKKQIVRLLPLLIKKRVVIIALKAFHHIARVTGPLVDLPVRLHSIYEVRTTILDGDCVPVIVKPSHATTVRSSW